MAESNKAADTIFFIIAVLIIAIITATFKALRFILSWVWRKVT